MRDSLASRFHGARAGLASILGPLILLLAVGALEAQQAREVEILAETQQKIGDLFILRGRAEIRFRGAVLKADEITYDDATGEATAEGKVELERESDVLRAERGHYNLHSGAGRFERVRALVRISPRPDPDLLVSPNPFYFEAESVERRPDGSYVAHHGWITNCAPESAKWKLRALRAVVQPGERVRLFGSSFHLGPIPLLFSPFFTHSLQERPRQTGFLLPNVGNNSRKGFTFGESFFWAINDNADLLVGAELFSQRGWSRRAELRILPSARSAIAVSYLGVSDWRQVTVGNRRFDQSGEFAHIFTEAVLGRGFRTVVDLTYLSSLRFRLGFSETFNEAVVSEVHANAFVSNNPDTFYFNALFRRYRNFEIRQGVSLFNPLEETSVTIAGAPLFEFGTRPRWMNLRGVPLYFSLDSSAGGLRRTDRRMETPAMVQRFDVYPRVTLPLLRTPWLQLTPTFGFRATRYGARLVEAATTPGCPPDGRSGLRVLNCALDRVTSDIAVDLRLPSLARVYERRGARYRHVLEPQITYRHVNGVRDFEQILRFDETDILSGTNELEYSLTQRLFRREPVTTPDASGGMEGVREVASWRLAQKYFFDPGLDGALVPGQRNVVTALASLTGFAWSLGPRRFSPLISTLKVSPGRRYDAEWRLDFDTRGNKLTSSRLLVSAPVARDVRAWLTHFVTRNDPLLQPRFHQLGFLVSYGQLNRRGLNAAFSAAWNIRQGFLPSTVAQVSYNWDCCGVALEFRRLGLGAVRSENQFRFAFLVANVGAAGTLRKAERLF